MHTLAARRPETLLLAALLALAAVVAWRGFQPPPAAFETPAPALPGDASAIARLQARLQRDPDDTDAAAALGLALIQRSRETGDPGLYAQAEQALQLALARDPRHLDALIGQGVLSLARHQFAEALAWGEQARDVAPARAAVYGVLTDAYVELGRYDEAVAAAQRMVDLRPDLDSYSRVSYLRELHGDVAGALAAMELAADAGGAGAENTAWARVQLGNLRLAAGDMGGAEAAYAQALAERPGYAHAELGAARALAARGELEAAAARYEAALARLPLAEHAIALGDLYEAMGRPEDAARQRELVGAMQRLSAAAGVDVELELALFEADHGADPAAAVARARAAYARRPSVVAADALAWALHRAGDREGAARHSAEALRLGTREPGMRFRAGMIALAAGDIGAARAHLAIALAGGLSPLHAAEARRALASTEN